jgi:hypothetical protein
MHKCRMKKTDVKGIQSTEWFLAALTYVALHKCGMKRLVAPNTARRLSDLHHVKVATQGSEQHILAIMLAGKSLFADFTDIWTFLRM